MDRGASQQDEHALVFRILDVHRSLPPPTLSFLLALNFLRHSTVSCLCIMDATVERCCGNTQAVSQA